MARFGFPCSLQRYGHHTQRDRPEEEYLNLREQNIRKQGERDYETRTLAEVMVNDIFY